MQQVQSQRSYWVISNPCQFALPLTFAGSRDAELLSNELLSRQLVDLNGA
jgi:hypothetical protein